MTGTFKLLAEPTTTISKVNNHSAPQVYVFASKLFVKYFPITLRFISKGNEYIHCEQTNIVLRFDRCFEFTYVDW